MTERILIEGCINKKQDYQKLLFDRYAGKMMSACLRYVNDERKAEDLLQEGFLKVFKYIHQYRFEGSLEGWMRRIFVSISLRALNNNKLIFTDLETGKENDYYVEPAVLSKLSEDEIHMMIRSLPDGYRMVFNLSVIEGYSHEEIAAMLGIQATTSRGQLLKARKHLQALILKKYNTIKI